jgi:hypothetical protein
VGRLLGLVCAVDRLSVNYALGAQVCFYVALAEGCPWGTLRRAPFCKRV